LIKLAVDFIGHRLKNAYGTKTTLALCNCCATKRLVLTGTPIQNNLKELYAVLQFVAPYYLGFLYF
jgi:SNF2 family DNA or RNA helicase